MLDGVGGVKPRGSGEGENFSRALYSGFRRIRETLLSGTGRWRIAGRDRRPYAVVHHAGELPGWCGCPPDARLRAKPTTSRFFYGTWWCVSGREQSWKGHGPHLAPHGLGAYIYKRRRL